MGLFSNQFSNVVEWEEYRDDLIFWKWSNKEIKKGSRLIIRQGQDAIFMYNGKVEGIFSDEGSYDVESEIVPFLSTLKGFKFGFNSGIRAEVLFVNTKEFTVKWGTKNPISIEAPGLPGGMPIRAFGTFNFKISDHMILIEKIAGVKGQYAVDDIKERVTAILNQLLMKWIASEGKNKFNLQGNAFDIAKGIKEDLDMEIIKIGITITGFNIESFTYPEEIEKMATKVASQSMIGDVGKYQNISMTDGIASGNVKSGGMASDMMGMQMGYMMSQQMMNNMQQNQQGQNNQSQQSQNTNNGGMQGNMSVVAPKFCPNCGNKTEGAKFCSNCGNKLIP